MVTKKPDDDKTLSQQLGDKIEDPARKALDKVGSAFDSVMNGDFGPTLDNVQAKLAEVSRRAGPEIMDTAFGAALADITGSGWGGKIVYGALGYFLGKKGFLGFMDNDTGRAIQAGVVGLSLLKNGNDVLKKMGVPGTEWIEKNLFGNLPEIAVLGGVGMLAYTLFKPALDPLIKDGIGGLHDGSIAGMAAHPAGA